MSQHPHVGGKLPRKPHPATMKLVRGVAPAYVPKKVDWTAGIKAWPMDLNDAEGDCTIAAAAHTVQVHAALMRPWGPIPAVADCQAAYVAVTGSEGAAYNPSTGANDNGCVMTDVLQYWKTSGIGGHTIVGWCSVAPTNLRDVMLALMEYGPIYVGLDLPISAQHQQVWEVAAGPDGQPGSWGGHCVPVVAADEAGLTCVTWGALKAMTWGFLGAYSPEAYAVLSAEWCNTVGMSPAGAFYGTLLGNLTGGNFA